MKRFFAFLVVFAFITGARADMYPDASNAKLPDARTNMAIVPHVATNAALKASATTLFPGGVWRDDFAAGRGAVPLWYVPSGGVCSIASGAGDNGAQVKSADNKCWLAVFPAGGVTPLQWGAIGDGTTDDTASLQAALTAMAGQALQLGKSSYFVGSNLSIPAGTTLKGPFAKIGAVAVSHSASIPYPSYSGIRLASAAGIIMLSSSAIDGVMIYRSGMTFPALNSSAFAGTALTVGGDNITLRNSLIMGFAQAISSNTFSRGTIEDVSFDNQANILIQGSTDTWHINNNHAWPFASDSPTMAAANWTRTGANFKIATSNDATMIANNLSFGYAKGYVFADNQGATCVNCDADNNGVTGSHGFEITGTTANALTTFIAPQAFANDIGIYRSDTGGINSIVLITGATITGSSVAGIDLDGTTGITTLYNSNISANTSGITIGNGSSILDMDGNVMVGNGAPYAITALSANDNIYIGRMNRFGSNSTTGMAAANLNVITHAITASGTGLTLPPFGTFFYVAAGGSVTDLFSGWAGRQVTLQFGGVTTLQNAAGAAHTTMVLKGGVNFVSAVNNAITFAHTGSGAWVEVSRTQ